MVCAKNPLLPVLKTLTPDIHLSILKLILFWSTYFRSAFYGTDVSSQNYIISYVANAFRGIFESHKLCWEHSPTRYGRLPVPGSDTCKFSAINPKEVHDLDTL
jgi:hypothetical protein